MVSLGDRATLGVSFWVSGVVSRDSSLDPPVPELLGVLWGVPEVPLSLLEGSCLLAGLRCLRVHCYLLWGESQG